MKYEEKVAHNLKGCEAVSTGLCGECDECRSSYDAYKVRETEDDTLRLTFKAADGATWLTEAEAEAASRQAFADDLRAGHVEGAASFSWSECDICGSRLGGDREAWHYMADGKLRHCEGACVDCVAYLANGTVPA